MMAVRIKICGITNPGDATISAELGADTLGFIFYGESPRYITPQKAREIIRTLPPFVSTVGVFVNETENIVLKTAELCNLHEVQLSGDEPPDFLNGAPFKVIRAVRVKDRRSFESIRLYPKGTSFLLDTFRPGSYGGTGETFDWEMIRGYTDDYRIIIAGGLVPENVGDVIKRFRPFGVDVSSGVESSPGRKDPKKIRDFIENARLAQNVKEKNL